MAARADVAKSESEARSAASEVTAAQADIKTARAQADALRKQVRLSYDIIVSVKSPSCLSRLGTR